MDIEGRRVRRPLNPDGSLRVIIINGYRSVVVHCYNYEWTAAAGFSTTGLVFAQDGRWWTPRIAVVGGDVRINEYMNE